MYAVGGAIKKELIVDIKTMNSNAAQNPGSA